MKSGTINTEFRMISGGTMKTLLAAVCVILGLACSASADPVLDFGIVGPTPGLTFYLGGTSPIFGFGIELDNVTGLNTPLNNNVTLPCVDCSLNFITGDFTGSTATTWNFGPGGFLFIAGSVAVPGGAGPFLMLGSFTSAVVTAARGSFNIAASFSDIKDSNLAAYYGLPGGLFVPWHGTFNITFDGAATPPGPFFSLSVLSNDVVNTTAPEPTTIILLGTGLACVALWGRRKSKS